MKKIFFILLLLLSCQGPWSYYPENPETYQGIWIYAYVVSGRPVENVCLDKLHSLKEVRLQGFAFYEEADVKISGSFNGEEMSLSLEPDIIHNNNPNCFVGPKDLLADVGGNYELNISITWDSAGKKTISKFRAETYIPQEFKILRAYNLQKQQFNPGETILYLPAPMDLQSNYFIPKYSDDVGGVFVSSIFDHDVFWGEDSIDKFIENFSNRNDTARKAQFGDSRILISVENRQLGDINKAIDSIPIMGIMMPAIGDIKLLFYATTPDYFKFRNTFFDSDSRVEPIYNIDVGAGIFAGMLVDTFNVRLDTLSSIKVYPYLLAQEYFCDEVDERTNTPNLVLHRECVEYWDQFIWDKISTQPMPPWYDIPGDKLREVLSSEEFVTWCEHRYFPIGKYPPCGSALVLYSKSGKNSPILDREVKKWCETNNDPECG
ncbi:MAG: hypothetical protein LBU89_07305 [Fibromonadaceae bacterium]|jgi:hypothetical protein|nr:hypothetical protein [Fibromonadaceae bacterium]